VDQEQQALELIVWHLRYGILTLEKQSLGRRERLNHILLPTPKHTDVLKSGWLLTCSSNGEEILILESAMKKRKSTDANTMAKEHRIVFSFELSTKMEGGEDKPRNSIKKLGPISPSDRTPS